MALKNINPTKTEAWKQLTDHFANIKNIHLKEFFSTHQKRAEDFKLAVDRNNIKRQIKETFRTNNLFSEKGCFVVIVYKDYFNDASESPSVEIIKAVESSNH